MIGLIFLIIISFSLIWLLVWFWFFKSDKMPKKINVKKIGETAFKQGDYIKAKEFLTKAVEEKNNPDLKYKLGFIELKMGNYKTAQESFEEVLRISPKNFDALLALAKISQYQGDYEGALDTYNKTIKEFPKKIEGYLGLIQLNIKKENYTQASEILEKIKKQFKEDIKLKFYTIKCKSKLCNIENEDGHKQILDEFLKLEGNSDLPGEFDITVAQEYAMQGQIDKAFEYSRKAVDIDSENIESYQLLGLIQLLKNDFENAKSNLTMALNLQPNNNETHNLFSYLLCTQMSPNALCHCRKMYYELINEKKK